MPTLKPGQIISGYEIIAFHGKGGMGEIFRARQLSIGREVALKILSPELARKDRSFAKKFIEEAQAAGRLNHPNIIAVHDVGEVKVAGRDEKLSYFSMEFIEGENLKQYLDREGTCDIDLVGRIMIGMSDALVYAEQMGMVHRDIKPENIMVTTDGRIKLADFGLAQQMESVDGSPERDEKGRVKVMGTPRYMSPEQARGRSVDCRSDQYSLGASLFHLLTGSPPFRKDSGRETMKAHVFDPVPDPGELVKVPPAWRSLCMRLMAKKPEDRFDTAAQLREATGMAVAGQSFRMPVAARRSGARHSAYQSAPQRSNTVPLLAVAGVVIVAGIAAALVFMPGGGDTNGPVMASSGSSGGGDPSGGDESDSDGTRLRRAEDLIAELPADSQEALRRLDRALANPYFRNGTPPRQLLEDHRQMIQNTIAAQEQERRQALVDRLREVMGAANRGALATARSELDAIGDEVRSLAPGQYERARQIIAARSDEIADELQADIASATDGQQLDGIAANIAASGLDDQRRAGLDQRLAQRRSALEQAAQAAAAELASVEEQRFQRLSESLLGFRANAKDGPDVDAFANFARDYRRRFETDEMRELCANYQAVANHARSVRNAIDRHIRNERPTIGIAFGGETQQARIDELDGDDVWVEVVRLSARIKKGLRDPEVHHQRLAREACTSAGLGNDALGSYLWLWGDNAAIDLVRDGGGANLAAALQRLGSGPQLATQSPDEDPQVDTGGDDPAPQAGNLELDFTADAGAPLDAFAGQGLRTVRGEAVWSTDAKVTIGQLDEANLPALRLNHPISQPAEVEMVCRIHPGSLILIGLERDGKAVRLGLDTRKRRVGGVITGDNGRIVSDPFPRDERAVEGRLTLRITIDAGGVCEFYLNDRHYDEQPRNFRLPGAGPAQLTIQALNVASGTSSGLAMERIRITGN